MSPVDSDPKIFLSVRDSPRAGRNNAIVKRPGHVYPVPRGANARPKIRTRTADGLINRCILQDVEEKTRLHDRPARSRISQNILRQIFSYFTFFIHSFYLYNFFHILARRRVLQTPTYLPTNRYYTYSRSRIGE